LSKSRLLSLNLNNKLKSLHSPIKDYVGFVLFFYVYWGFKATEHESYKS
jgi:hypothetical protein